MMCIVDKIFKKFNSIAFLTYIIYKSIIYFWNYNINKKVRCIIIP